MKIEGEAINMQPRSSLGMGALFRFDGVLYFVVRLAEGKLDDGCTSLQACRLEDGECFLLESFPLSVRVVNAKVVLEP